MPLNSIFGASAGPSSPPSTATGTSSTVTATPATPVQGRGSHRTTDSSAVFQFDVLANPILNTSSSSHFNNSNIGGPGAARGPAMATAMATAGSVPSFNANAPHEKIISAIINRIKVKLPCNSGTPVSVLEQDEAFNQAVTTLIHLARHRLDHITMTLCEMLDKMHADAQTREANLEYYQSQLLLTKILASAMQFRWDTYREEMAQSDLQTPASPISRTPQSAQSPHPSQLQSPQMTQSPLSATTQSPPPITSPSDNRPSNHSTTSSAWVDPPALDDKVAKYAMSVMVLFIKQTGSWGDRPKASGHIHSDTLYDYETIDSQAMMLHTVSSTTFSASFSGTSLNSATSIGKGHSLGPSSLYRKPPNSRRTTSIGNPGALASLALTHGPVSTPSYGSAFASYHPSKVISFNSPILASTVASVNALISKYIHKIIFFISASNWSVVFARIRQKIRWFATGGDSHADRGKDSDGTSTVDNTDMKLLGFCAMDQARLIQLFQELSSLLVSMKREAQSSIALSLRSAIWNWITGFPDQFSEVIKSNNSAEVGGGSGGRGLLGLIAGSGGPRRLEGAPERVFDTLYGMMQDPGSVSTNRRIIWPTLAALLAVSPERLRQSEMALGGGYPASKKINAFLPTVSATMLHRDPKQSDIAMVCYLDLCKAAIYLPPGVEQAALRSLAPELADELRSRIMTPPAAFKPFYESHEPIDVNLYADILVAIFRFNPPQCITSVFPTLLQCESDAVRTCVVRCFVTLVSEKNKFEAQPGLEPLYPKFASTLRGLFYGVLRRHEADPSSRQLHAKSTIRPAAKKYGTDFYSDSNLLLLTLLTLYRLDIKWYFWDMGERTEHEVVKDCITLLSPHQDATIQATVAKTIHTLATGVMSMTGEEREYANARHHIYQLGLGTLVASAIGAMVARANIECLRSYFSLINMVFYNLELGLLDDTQSVWSNDGIVQMRLSIATACFTSLPVPQLDIAVLASRALRTMNLRQVPKPNMPTQVFRQSDEEAKARGLMEAIGDPKIPVLGRVAFQRRTRKLLRGSSAPNVAQSAGWAECYSFWTKLTKSYLEALKTPGLYIHEDQKFEWQNYTHFLASYCGGNFFPDKATHQKTPLVFATLTAWFTSETLPERFRVVTDFDEVTRDYVATVVDLLVHENLGVRETAKEALGSESHHLLYTLILLQLDNVVTRLFERRLPDWNPANTQILIDQTISVLKLIFDRLDEAGEVTHLNVDLSHIILQLASFLNAWPNGIATLRIKAKFCGLCNSLFSRSDVLAIKKGAVVRNSLLDSIHQWVITVPNDWPSNEKDQMVRRQAELDLACIQTAATMLEKLRLQPLDGSTGIESGLAISRLFTKYLNFFVASLEKAVIAEDASEKASAHSRQRSGGDNRSQGNIRELAIVGISNILSANMDAGLKHCLAYGYHEDARMRATFILIFTRVLRQGARFDGVEVSTTQPKHRRLCEMVRADMLLALAICETCPVSEIEVMIPVMINIFDTKASLLALLKATIDKEISRSDSPTELFRANTMSTRLLSKVARTQGYNYLRLVIAPLLDEMGRHPMDREFQLDPTKAKQSDVDVNISNLKRLAQMFLEVITNSASVLPPMCREVCAHIAERVSLQWAESKYSAVGGFLFLRFICPAIVSPEGIDLPVDPSLKKGLLLITKIVQNLANNVLFGKEQHMMVLNGFLEDNILSVTHFLSEVVTLPEYDVEDTEEWHGSSYDEADSIVLHRFFHHSADKVGKELLSFSRLSPEDGDGQSGKQTWDNLCSTLVEMGQPVLIPPPTKDPAAHHSLFQDFMRAHEQRPVDHVRDLFISLPTPPGTNSVYTLSLCRINVETVELDVLIMHIFKTLLSSSGNFDVVIDCTGFTSSSEIPFLWLKVFLERCPLEFVQGFSRAFILNANNAAAKFLRKLYHISAGTPLAKSSMAISSVQELKTHLPDITADALVQATGLEREKVTIYNQVAQQSRHGMRLPISLFVCETHIRIVSLRSQTVWPGLECRVNEIILLSDIGDVYNVSTGHEANEFIIRRSRYGGTLYFSSLDRDAIVHAIRTTKGKLRADNVQAYERTYSSGEISATILNIALLNLGAEDDALRSTAYDLACSVSSSLNFDDSQTIPVNGGFVPANPLSLAAHMSERLAVHSPNLTLDVITEFARGFHRSSRPHKAICLYYLQPWIKNLSTLPDPSVTHSNPGGRLRDAFRILIDLLIKDDELAPVIHKTIWTEVAKLDPGTISIALDELVRAAADGGLGSRRCEIIADTIVVISSISVRGKILSKLRKAIGKTILRPSQALTSNTSWNEVAAIARLALYAGYNSKTPAHNQLFVSETAHLITLLAGAGPVLMRTTVHGMAVNLIQSLYVSKADDTIVAPKLKAILEEAHSKEVLAMFGLISTGPVGDYAVLEEGSDVLSVDALEGLAKLMIKILTLGAQSSSGSNLINVWRARWMSLVISTAFHVSYIQSRAFVVMGVLATSDVDDDLLYQILVAFKNSLTTSISESDLHTPVGMLRCITKVVPGTPKNGRYLPQLLWLAIGLMQCGDVGLFTEAAELLQTSLETLDAQGAFADMPLPAFFFEARIPLEEVTLQIDDYIGLSFESNFSFSLASVIFKGLRHPAQKVQDVTTAVLRTLLKITTRTSPPIDSMPRSERAIPPDSVGYFLALLPTTPNVPTFQVVLRDAGAGKAWLDTSARSTDSEDTGSARVPLPSLGLKDAREALLAASFLGTMLNSATANPEREMLFSLLADMAVMWPEVLAQIYESIQERVIDAFSNVTNPTILSAVGEIFRASMLDFVYQHNPTSRTLNGSASTVGTFDPAHPGAGRMQIQMLEEMGMRGVLAPHLFLSNAGGNRLLGCIVELVGRIIE